MIENSMMSRGQNEKVVTYFDLISLKIFYVIQKYHCNPPRAVRHQ